MVEVKKVAGALYLSGQNFNAAFDLSKGILRSYIFSGMELLEKSPRLDFWRAPTDNDFGNGMPRRCQHWKDAWKKRKVKKVTYKTMPGGEVKVTAEFELPPVKSKAVMMYTVYADGEILFENSFSPGPEPLPELPRFGMNIILPGNFKTARWFGRGPHESYADRKSGAIFGVYQRRIRDLYHPYIRPQENGYRTDVYWLALESNAGVGLFVSGDPLFCFRALHHLMKDFDPGLEKRQRHTIDVKARDLVSLNCDLGQMGVGGDDSWGAPVHAKYRLPAKPYRYRVRIRPYRIGSEAPEKGAW